jgi:leader peptidase (prepilin peptidase)/N-methyltransferase
MIITLVVPLFAGMLAGWIVNGFADTLPITRRLSRPACGHCGKTYPWAAYLTFRACPNCGHSPRGWRPWFVQGALVALSFYTWLKPSRLGYWMGLLLLTYFAIVVVIDLEHRLILHSTSVAGALLGLGSGIFLHGIPVTLIGGAASYAIMLVFYLLGEVFVRYMSRRRGEAIEEVALGYGDVNLAGIMGLFLGWPGIIIGLLFTILAGGVVSLAVVAIMLIRRRYQAFSAIPYGPFLVFSILVLLFRS